MTDARAAAIEAAAKKICMRDGEDWAKLDETCPIGVTRELYRALAEAAVDGFAKAGWVMVRDVGGMTFGDAAKIYPGAQNGGTKMTYIRAWNACRAAMLGEKTDGQG